MTRKLHLLTGCLITLFLAVHLTVNLFALAGPAAHNAALQAVQWTYRNPVVEPLLILALLFQVGLGLRLAVRRWREPGKSGWAKLQLASGIFLAYFIINHGSAALYTRYVGLLDTNFWWVSGPLVHPALQGFFYPYYALAVLSVGVHLGAALHFSGRPGAARVAAIAGIPVVLAYWASFGGWLYVIPPNPAYRAFFDALLAILGFG